ncbi:Glycosyltransferase involved in cell wall bisynthesis [Amycolatopsis arida]|uniref:Glycosyltransferase involved in cell wall bisynthesis n=1 Tax=Amycolatopsis arida TaxID=587909 RepID=A0A1I5XEH2_9PSEU|nr:glycosyltransferase [Amycolatopsis arida]TDX97500.1 glycosyltransferase involved in cell wall biosynthesis [Amycolatopsis arida]SFQ30383.1 Glycosyltransferase involved in cell wall bisynthesis [Amycolatopsis arida]
MRVLHVITGLAAGGAETQLRHLLRHSAADAEVIALTNPGAVADALRADGVPVSCVDMRGNRDLTALPRLVGRIRAGRFDVVHTHLYRAMLFGRLAARLAGVRHVVATEHSLAATTIEGRPRDRAGVRALYLAAERLGRLTVAVSERVAGAMVEWGVPAERIRVVPNGIDLDAFAFDGAARAEARARLGLAPEAFVVGAVGRLVPTKRFDVLVRALPAMPGAVLLIAGEGPLRTTLAELAARLGVRERVLLAGEVDDMRGMLSAVDVLGSPSTEETFGLAILEALAAGLPTAYACCPALDGLPAGAAPRARRADPTPEAFAAALTALRGDPAREVPPAARHYDIARAAAAIDALHSELVTGARAAA